MSNYEFNWSELAFADKGSVNVLNAIFLAAPREMSAQRFSQIIKTYLPKGNLVIGLAKEDYVLGFEDQPQFKTLKFETIKDLINKVNKSTLKQKIYTLSYNQRDTNHLVEKLRFKQIVFVNGSWQYAFQNSPVFYELVKKKISFELISPFSRENEAKEYCVNTTKQIDKNIVKIPINKYWQEDELFELVANYAKKSFDHNFQTAALLAKKTTKGYKVLARSYNQVVPYDTYAMHFGSVRETNFAATNDQNYYDTVHAEVNLILQAQKDNIDIRDSILFINLLPCPSCSRMLSLCPIKEVIYQLDHSAGYAHHLLEKAGKKIRNVN